MSNDGTQCPASPAVPGERGSGVRGFLTGTGLPIFLLAALLVYEAFLLAIVLAPGSAGAWGGFAREFKQWCFRYDPRTGGMEWSAVWVMLGEPAFIALIALWLTRRELASLRTLAGCAARWKPAACGAATAALAVAGLFIWGRPVADADMPLPFPGERIRTHLQAPRFASSDHHGSPFRLEDLRGRVVLLTGVYAACPTGACSAILRETRALLDELPPEARAHLTVAALSLNPEHDTPEVRNRIAEAYSFPYPEFRYLNGEAAATLETATQLGFAPALNPETGAIDHANLFLLIDARGEIAYRLTLDDRHRSWLREGILALTQEAESP
jgi:cytochrome oxidase Cu insertion factor (SCO1/SenC/PrrC family)